jgi:glutamate racemase
VRLGVFDSGLGGLTVVREIKRLLPLLDIVYIGDSKNAPYGARSEDQIQQLSLAQTRFLLERCGCDAILLACNTATAAAIAMLRATFLDTPIIGMEPAVKPAISVTKTNVIGVLATVGTLKSAKFAALLEIYQGSSVVFLTQACPGWVEAVESGAFDSPETQALIARDIIPLLQQNADTLVLGCTHFPALKAQIAKIAPNVTLIDTGEAVARRVAAVLSEEKNNGTGALTLYTTGDASLFSNGATAILGFGAALPLYWEDGELVIYAKN